MTYIQPAPETSPAADAFSEAALSSRPDAKGLLYTSHESSFEMLSALGIDWNYIRGVQNFSGKPISDLGASFTSFALEGELRRVRVVPIDISYQARGLDYETDVMTAFKPLLRYYCGITPFPTGFELSADKRIEGPDDEAGILGVALRNVAARRTTADFASLPFPDRAFSMSLAVDAAPKHSATFSDFAFRQFPEMLRVTDRELRISPLSMYKEGAFRSLEEMKPYKLGGSIFDCGDEALLEQGFKLVVLIEVEPIYQNLEQVARLREIASLAGFDLSVESGNEISRGNNSKPRQRDVANLLVCRRR